MTKLKLVALAAAPLAMLTFTAAPAMAQDDDGEDATQCLSLSDDGKLMNSCSYTIEAVWCVENIDCRNGTYSNMATIGANSYYPINGGRSGNYVRWGACRGRNSISTNGTRAYSWEHICKAGY